MNDPVVGITTRADRVAQKLELGYAYITAITGAGGVPLPIPLLAEEQLLRRFYCLLDGLLLSGGGDVAAQLYGASDAGRLQHVDPLRDQVELRLACWAIDEGLPILGICRGMQSLNVAAGGTLVQDIPSELPTEWVHAMPPRLSVDHPAHPIILEPRSRLVEMLFEREQEDRTIWVNSRHHQAVRVVAPGFVVSARAPDGVIEAIEHGSRDALALGVQWHPENMTHNTAMRRLFRHFVEAARSRC